MTSQSKPNLMPFFVGIFIVLPLIVSGGALGAEGLKLASIAAVTVLGICHSLRRLVAIASPADSSAAYRMFLAAATRLLLAVVLITLLQASVSSLLDSIHWETFGLLLVWFYAGQLWLDVLGASELPTGARRGATLSAGTR